MDTWGVGGWQGENSVIIISNKFKYYNKNVIGH